MFKSKWPVLQNECSKLNRLKLEISCIFFIPWCVFRVSRYSTSKYSPFIHIRCLQVGYFWWIKRCFLSTWSAFINKLLRAGFKCSDWLRQLQHPASYKNQIPTRPGFCWFLEPRELKSARKVRSFKAIIHLYTLVALRYFWKSWIAVLIFSEIYFLAESFSWPEVLGHFLQEGVAGCVQTFKEQRNMSRRGVSNLDLLQSLIGIYCWI